MTSTSTIAWHAYLLLLRPRRILRGYLAWCARQPATPAATLAAWRRGSFSFAPEARP